jgi:hypothetical protein
MLLRLANAAAAASPALKRKRSEDPNPELLFLWKQKRMDRCKEETLRDNDIWPQSGGCPGFINKLLKKLKEKRNISTRHQV